MAYAENYLKMEDPKTLKIQQNTKQQVLVRLWRKGNSSALLVGMQTGAATMENSMKFPQKTKNGTAF